MHCAQPHKIRRTTGIVGAICISVGFSATSAVGKVALSAMAILYKSAMQAPEIARKVGLSAGPTNLPMPRMHASTFVAQSDSDNTVLLRVSLGTLLPIEIGSLILCGFCVVLAGLQGAAIAGLIFAGLFLLSLYLLLSTGRIEVTRDTLRYCCPKGRYEMRFDDVTHMEQNPSAIVFFGGDKRLSIPAPSLWGGSDKQPLFELLDQFVTDYHIQCVTTLRAAFLPSKGTKVRATSRLHGPRQVP